MGVGNGILILSEYIVIYSDRIQAVRSSSDVLYFGEILSRRVP